MRKILLILISLIIISCDKPADEPLINLSEYIPKELTKRSNSCLFYDSNLEILNILGGFNKDNNYNELWQFNTNTKHFEKISLSDKIKAGGRNRYCVFDFQNSYLYMYGLEKKGDASPSAILKLGTITKKVEILENASKMPTLRGHSLDLLSNKSILGEKSLVIFGGKDITSNYNNDIYLYKLDGKEIEKLEILGNKPRPRAFHTSLIYNNKLIVIGGYSGDILNDIWSFDFQNKKWELLMKSSSLLNFYDAAKNYNYRTQKLYILGGKNEDKYPSSNFIVYDPNKNNLTSIKNDISKRYGIGITSSEYSLYLFGGRKINNSGETIFINDFWRYDIEQ